MSAAVTGKAALLNEHTRHEIDEWVARFPEGKQRSAVLSALRVYRSGRGLAGKLTWTLERGLCDALERCFDLSFRAITPSGK